MIVILATASLLCWAALAWLFPLRTFFDVPAFSLDKVPGHFASPAVRLTLALLLALSLFYGLGLWAIARERPLTRTTRLAMLLWVVGGGVAALLLYPITALDVYTYLTLLKVAHFYHLNPYVVTVSMHPWDPWTAYDFFRNNPATYGPGWFVLSALPAAFIRWNDLLSGLLALKGYNLLLVGATAAMLAQCQRDPSGNPRRHDRWLAAWAFAANPLVLFEAVGNGHNDIYTVAALVAAIWALRRRSALVLPLLTLSVSIKFITVTVAPLFAVAILVQRWTWRKLALAIGLALGLGSGVAAPYWAGGRMLKGLFAAAQDYYHIPGSSLLLLLNTYLTKGQPDPAAATRLLPMMAFPVALVCAWAVWRYLHGASFALAAAAVLLVSLQLLSRYCPWYLIYPIVLVALSRDRAGSAVLTALTALNLAWAPICVWAFFDAHYTLLKEQWLGVLLLTLPGLAFVGWWASRAPARAGGRSLRPTPAEAQARSPILPQATLQIRGYKHE